MKAWIFQGKPERYDLRAELQEGKTETWLVTRYREKMAKEDIVYFWRSGSRDERGLYGWGHIISEAARFYKDWGWGIDAQYLVRFNPHINVSVIEEDGVLKNNLLLRMAIGTNFELTNEEANSLAKLIRTKGQHSPPNL
jgi:EVE domain